MQVGGASMWNMLDPLIMSLVEASTTGPVCSSVHVSAVVVHNICGLYSASN